MANLTADLLLIRRGPASPRAEFGYPIAPSEKVFRGSLIGVNSSGQAQRISTAGTVAFIGVSDRNLDNSASSAAGGNVIGLKGCWGLTVPSATVSNIGATVYAAGTDDHTLTLTNSGTLTAVGTLAGIENSATFVTLVGS